MLGNGVPINSQEGTSQLTPLHCAAAAGQYLCLKALITYQADINDGVNNRSPLFYAVQNSATECVEELLQNKAIPNMSKVNIETN